MKIVISLGGSIIIPKELDVIFLKKFSKLIKELKKKHKLSIVCGGGYTARLYTRKRKELGLTIDQAHKLGIFATHLNSKLVAELIGGKFSNKHPEKIGRMRSLIVSGGYKVGWTTDTDAALIAKTMKADVLINLTNVKGVYTKDPNKYKNAEFIEKMSWEKFENMFGKKITGAGKHYVFDPVAGQICKKNKIKVIILGKDIKNLNDFIKNRNFVGTVIE